MRALAIAIVFCTAAAQLLAGAQERVPRDNLYRGPLYWTREATLVEPETGLPLGFLNTVMTRQYSLYTNVRSKTLRTIPASAITLRVAFGPTALGMISYRARTVERVPELLARIAPGQTTPLLQFKIVREDPEPGALALKPEMKIVYTLERIDGDNGVPVFENPDAAELLWVALGRPSLSSQ